MPKNLPANAEGVRDEGLIPGSGYSLEECMVTQSSILAHGERGLAGHSLWHHKELDATEATNTFTFFHLTHMRCLFKHIR